MPKKNVDPKYKAGYKWSILDLLHTTLDPQARKKISPQHLVFTWQVYHDGDLRS